MKKVFISVAILATFLLSGCNATTAVQAGGAAAAYGTKYLQEIGEWREAGHVLASKPVKALEAACDKELALGNIEKGIEYCDRALEKHKQIRPQPLAERIGEYF